MLTNLKEKLQEVFQFSPNKNQLCDIERLVFEIMRRENTALEEVIQYLKSTANIEKYGGRNKFFAIKDVLVKRRFPLTSAKGKIDTKKLFLNQLKEPPLDNWQASNEFKPLRIFVEKEAQNSYLVSNFKEKFPQIEIVKINRYNDYLKENKFSIGQLKKPLVFIIKEKSDFLKPCPCTRGHLGCGYWILNLGFGCPYDCSYCFLQCYTNFPGILLPANIDDFFAQFNALYEKIKKPIRIGTGEFCDSLALDHITEYSKKLIPFFKNKNGYFELKTKSANINNILEIDASPNIVISWSLNPNELIKSEELATAALGERLEAAKKVKQKGYNIAFHFDPIIYSENYKSLYQEVVEKIYSHLPGPFAWISLGTLRSHRQLKSIAEQRFSKSNIFYGELLLSEDKKLRYPKFLRQEIYKNMLKLIRSHDNTTPLYLCMEDKETWAILGKGTPAEIEAGLLR